MADDNTRSIFVDSSNDIDNDITDGDNQEADESDMVYDEIDETKQEELINGKQTNTDNNNISQLQDNDDYDSTNENKHNDNDNHHYELTFDGDGQIKITDALERKGTITKYTVYVIESSIYGETTTVERRYNDFKWLYTMLGLEFLGVFIPPIPPKNTFERFSGELINQRKYDLNRFLNRISSGNVSNKNNNALCESQSMKLFLNQENYQTFENEKKIISHDLTVKTDIQRFDILKQLFPDLDNTDDFNDNSDQQDGDEHDLEPNNVYIEDIPRVKEVHLRCQERLERLCRASNALFQIFSNMCSELSILHSEMCGLYDLEYNEFEKASSKYVANECEKREDVRDMFFKWKNRDIIQMNCFYKYFVLNLRFEHEDCIAFLDIFKRYDVVYNRYRLCLHKYHSYQKQLQNKPDLDNNDNGDGSNKLEQLILDLRNAKVLLDLVCDIILKNQCSDVWNAKIENYNKQIACYIGKLTDPDFGKNLNDSRSVIHVPDVVRTTQRPDNAINEVIKEKCTYL